MTMKGGMLTAVFAMGLSLAIAASPADAQGNGRGRQDRDDRELADVLRDEELRRAGQPRGNGAGKVPPGWCRGVGNPHNTPENCGYSRDSQNRYPPDDRYPVYERDRSYEQAHSEFHRQLDAHYNRLATQRPLDLQYQLELQVRKRAEHDDWHRRMGISH